MTQGSNVEAASAAAVREVGKESGGGERWRLGSNQDDAGERSSPAHVHPSQGAFKCCPLYVLNEWDTF